MSDRAAQLEHTRHPTAVLPRPHPAVVFQGLGEGAVLLSTSDEVYFGLNEVGAEVWQLLAPRCATLDEMVDAIVARYPEAPRAAVAADVAELLAELRAAGLVVDAGPSSAAA